MTISNESGCSEAELGASDASLDLLHHLISELSQSFSHIGALFLNDFYKLLGKLKLTFKERSELVKCCIALVIEPRLNKNAVVWLFHEVFGYIVNDDGLVQRTTDS